MKIEEINKRFKDKKQIEKLRHQLHKWHWIAMTQKYYLEEQTCFANAINNNLMYPTKKNLKKTINTIYKLEKKIKKILKRYSNEELWNWKRVISDYCIYEKEVHDFLNTLE